MRRVGVVLLITVMVMLLLALLFAPRPRPIVSLAPRSDAPAGILWDAGRALIDLNTADMSLLLALPGIGETLAQRIEAYRAAHGPFPSVDALDHVPGIGPKKLQAIRARLAVQAKP